MGQVECIQCGEEFDPQLRDEDDIVRGSKKCSMGGECYTFASLVPDASATSAAGAPTARAAASAAPVAPPPAPPKMTRQWTTGADKLKRVYTAKRAARRLANRARHILAAALAGRDVRMGDGHETPLVPDVTPMMDIHLRGRVKGVFTVPTTATAGDLAAIVRAELGDDRPFRMVVKGHTLTDMSVALSVKGVAHKSKVMIMASKRAAKPKMVEETPVPCVTPGCGFFGLPSNGKRCTPCLRKKQAADAEAARAAEEVKKEEVATAAAAARDAAQHTPEALEFKRLRDVAAALNERDRCGVESCRRKLRMLGITCRCGHTFCKRHRYAEQHACNFDHRDYGRRVLEGQLEAVTGDRIHDRL